MKSFVREVSAIEILSETVAISSASQSTTDNGDGGDGAAGDGYAGESASAEIPRKSETENEIGLA